SVCTAERDISIMPGSSRMPISLRGSGPLKPGAASSALSLGLVNLDLIRNIVFVYFVSRWTRRLYWKLKGRGVIGAILELYRDIRRVLYGWFLQAPGVRGQVRAKVKESLDKMAAKLVPPAQTRYLTLPKEGMPEENIRAELDSLANMDHTRWEDGYVSGAVYHGEAELIKLQTDAYGLFTVANPIHPDVFPGVRKMEAEVVSMVLNMFNAPQGAAGASTSGGTESILLACLAARQKAYIERGVTEPEMILPMTAHTAFRKAADYFKIKVHFVDCPAPNYQVDLRGVSRLINRNTVLLVGSAPNFPHGIIDDISGLSRLALRNKLWLHVDCCLGSFVIACLEKAGFESEPFDFRLKGVSSISVDTHKYGFAPKGNSTVLYRAAALRTYQYYNPPAIHVAVTLPITKVWSKLISDLETVVEDEREKERVRIVEGKGAKGKAVGDSAALYGVAGSLPNKSVVVDLATGFLDLLYKA
ncbi:hypothetical protein LLEC1_00951, partial [Akanthomyces lecanii]